jgi:hypothetical protein
MRGFRWSGFGPRIVQTCRSMGGAARFYGRETRAEYQAEIACQTGVKNGI